LLYLYADGRLIWSRYPAGWVEQRLTPEGVALVRAKILSTGLFDPNEPPPGSELGLDFPYYGDIEVRNHGRLVYVPGRQDQKWTSKFDRLHRRLRNLGSWLPQSAWQDPTIRTYVPTTYAICLSNSAGKFENQPPIQPSSLLPLLPAPAKDLLAGARHWRWQELASSDPATTRREGSTPLMGQGNPHCFDVTTEEARAIERALDDAGIAHDTPRTLIDQYDAIEKALDDAGVDPDAPNTVVYHFDAPDPVSRTVDIVLGPSLPHSVAPFSGG
jgi:hypothetical protein